MKLSAGKSLFHSGRGEWIKRNFILRLFPPGIVSIPVSAQPAADVAVSCELMPPAELRGVHFEDPLKAPIFPRVRLLSRIERLEQYPL